MDEFGFGGLLFEFAESASSGGDEAFDLELVRIEHEPNEGLLIVRIAADIGEDEQARLFGEGGSSQTENDNESGGTNEAHAKMIGCGSKNGKKNQKRKLAGNSF